MSKNKISLLDRISLHKTLAMLLDFILAVLKIFKQPNKIEDKKKPWWRRK